MINNFFQALTDLHSYPTSRDKVASRNHSGFLEIVTSDIMIQIEFYIPYQKGNIVVVLLGEFSETGGHYYADFQSELLYQWYQTYRHRWLNPDEAHPPEHAEDEDSAAP